MNQCETKFLVLLLVIGTFSICNTAKASLISHNGYTLSSSTDIVVGNGLEWLQWDVTAGESITSALDSNGVFSGVDYGPNWTIATNNQMAELFQSFTFRSTTDDYFEANTSLPYTSDDTTPYDNFISLFGSTYHSSGGLLGVGIDAINNSIAIYGDDPNMNGLYKIANVGSDYTHFQEPYLLKEDNFSALSQDFVYANTNINGIGVALVRKVSEPPTFLIVVLGLMGIGIYRQQPTALKNGLPNMGLKMIKSD